MRDKDKIVRLAKIQENSHVAPFCRVHFFSQLSKRTPLRLSQFKKMERIQNKHWTNEETFLYKKSKPPNAKTTDFIKSFHCFQEKRLGTSFDGSFQFQRNFIHNRNNEVMFRLRTKDETNSKSNIVLWNNRRNRLNEIFSKIWV